MPMVQVRITEGATRAQKEELIKEMTAVLVRVLGKNPASTHVVIEELPVENWGISGRSVAALREEGASGISTK